MRFMASLPGGTDSQSLRRPALCRRSSSRFQLASAEQSTEKEGASGAGGHHAGDPFLTTDVPPRAPSRRGLAPYAPRRGGGTGVACRVPQFEECSASCSGIETLACPGAFERQGGIAQHALSCRRGLLQQVLDEKLNRPAIGALLFGGLL